MKASERNRVIIVSGMAPYYVGGLDSYQRFLACALGEYFGIEGIFLVLKTEHPQFQPGETVPWPVEILATRRSWAGAQKLLFSMASRPVLHPFLERLVFWLVPPRSLERIAGSVRWMHFVGTGWQFFGFALLRWARRRGIRFTIWPAVHPRSWGDDAIDVRFYSGADGVFCQSNYEKGHLASLGVPERVITHCGLPPMCRMDGDRERFRADHCLTENMPAVLFLGRRDDGKGYPALLEAWPLVLQKCAQAVVLLAGAGGSEFRNLLAALPPASFRDLGMPDETVKAGALAGCDVFCLPSAHESFGIAYVEAWSYGKPVICGTAPACREMIEDGVTGLWADQDPASLANTILSLLQQPELRKRLGREGQARQQRDFTPESVARIHLQAVSGGDTWAISS